MKPNHCLLLTTLLFSQMSFSQLPTKEWDVRFGGTKQDELQTMKHTADGGYILGGYSASAANGDKSQANQGLDDFWIVKTDSNGSKQWDKTFGGTDDDDLISLEVTTDGGFILGGYSKSGISGDKSQASQGGYDFWMVKTDANGTKQWDKCFGGTDNDYLTAIHQTTDGGYILGGYTASEAGGDVSQAQKGQNDYWIVKTDPNGIKQWDARFGGDKKDQLQSLVQTSDGGFLLAGTSYSNANGDKTQMTNGSGDFWIVKTDVNGVKQWDAGFGGDSTDYCNAIISTLDGGFLIGGYSYSGISGDKSQRVRGESDYWVVKIDGEGLKQWEKTFGGIGADVLTSIIQSYDGGYLLAGYSGSESSGEKSQSFQGASASNSHDYWLVKTDEVGNYLWDRRFGGSNRDLCYSVLENSDHSFSLGGLSYSPADGDKSQGVQGSSQFSDYWLLKTTAPGNIPNIYVGTIAPTSFLQGNVFNVPYTVNGIFNSGNIFYAILSTNTGSFNTSDTIGSVNSNTSGTIIATFPADILNGLNYHVRIISSDPASTSAASEDVITLGVWSSVIEDFVYGGNLGDLCYDMIRTTDDGLVLGGRTNSDASGDVSQSPRGGDDYWIIKTDTDGEKQWDARFGTSSEETFSTVRQTLDGGFILGGNTSAGINGDKTEDNRGGEDYWIVKTDSTGAKQWDKRYGGSAYDLLHSILPTADGGYLLGGKSQSPLGFDKSQGTKGGVYYDYWVVKTDANGNKLWDKTYGGDEDDDLTAMVATSDGGYILAGTTHSPVSDDVTDYSRGLNDFWLVKIDVNGLKQWDRRYGGTSAEDLTCLRQTFDGGYILAGETQSPQGYEVSEPSYGNHDYWMIKIDTNENKEWDMRFGGGGFDNGSSVIQTLDSGYLIGGYSDSRITGNKTQESRGNYDYWVVRLNSKHKILWDSRFGGDQSDQLQSIVQISDGNFVLAGYSSSPANGDKSQSNHINLADDFWVVKINDTLFPNSIITNEISPLVYTAGDVVNVPFTATGIYVSGNIFTAELSDATGNFSSPTTIGSLTSTSLDTINATIPIATPAGNGYRIRVVSSNPSVIGSDNEEDITINSLSCDVAAGEFSSHITATSAKLNWYAVPGAIGYKVRYKIASTSEWIVIQSNDNDKSLSGLTPNTEYIWQVKSICGVNPIVSSEWSAKQFFTTSSLKQAFDENPLLDIYPNPFSSSTTISFSLLQDGNATITLYDLAGRKIETVLDENVEAGSHKVQLTRGQWSGGIYFLKMKLNESIVTTKIIIQ